MALAACRTTQQYPRMGHGAAPAMLRPPGIRSDLGGRNVFWRSLEAGLAACLLAGCQGEEPASPPSTVDSAIRFQAVIAGSPIHLALDDCQVFRIAADGLRDKVLTTDPYPMLSACKVQKVSADGDFITVELGRQALGAGGCCATEGLWRSRDGIAWERRHNGRWVKPATPAAGKP